MDSTIYATQSNGTPLTDQRYFAYGRIRNGGTLPTDHWFTGQQVSSDNGLYYYGARYYDPEIGQFISPDSLVPDATSVVDYNRYMAARGNPIRYNDPSGHCATNQDGSRAESDAQCWQLAYSISGYADGLDAFDSDWGEISGKQWLANIATASYANVKYLQPFSEKYYSVWRDQVGLPIGNYTANPVPNDSQAFELFMKNSGAQKLEPAFEGLVHPDCNNRDCVAIGLDTVGVIGSAVKYGSPLCGSAAAGCANIGGGISNAATGLGALWTGFQYVRHKDSNSDLVVGGVTGITGVATKDPRTGLIVGLSQLAWDTVVSPIWNTLWK